MPPPAGYGQPPAAYASAPSAGHAAPGPGPAVSDLPLRIREQLGRAIIGQQRVIDEVLIGLLCGGHVIIEGLPGLGKTLLVQALAKTFSGNTRRIQFTPDLMPSDITGHVMFDVKSGEFETRRGPVFTNLLLADEINRAPAKTQAAMLEVMQEGQVTLEGTSMRLERPFMTLATQNPSEQEGTYPLPDAQLDRFLLKIQIDYPAESEEAAMVAVVTQGQTGDALNTQQVEVVATPQDILGLQAAVAAVAVADSITAYAVKIVRSTRQWPGIALGAGPRGGIAIIRAARAWAVLQGRGFVTPDDVKYVALPALRHRISLSPESELEGRTADTLILDLLSTVEAPRQ